MTIFYNICSVLLYISLYLIASVCLHFSAYAKDKKEKKLFVIERKVAGRKKKCKKKAL